MRVKKLIFIIILVIFLCSFLNYFTFAAESEEPIKISAYWVASKDRLVFKALEKFGNAVEERTGGRVKFTYYCCNTLGADLEAFETLRMGSLDMHLIAVGKITGYHEPLLMIMMPFIFKDDKHVLRVVKSPIWDKLTKGLEEKNIKLLGLFHAGFRAINTTDTPIHSVKDVKGLKIRVPPINSWLTTWKVFGALPVAMASEELYMSLMTGVVDAQENGPMNTKDMKLHEVTKYFSNVPYAWLGPALTINYQKWQSIPIDIQNIMIEEVEKSAKYTFDEGQRLNDEALVWMEEEAGIIVDHNPDIESFRKKAEEAYKIFEKEEWYDPEIVQAIRDLKE